MSATPTLQELAFKAAMGAVAVARNEHGLSSAEFAAACIDLEAARTMWESTHPLAPVAPAAAPVAVAAPKPVPKPVPKPEPNLTAYNAELTRASAHVDIDRANNPDEPSHAHLEIAVQNWIRKSRDNVLFLPNDYLDAPTAATRIFKYFAADHELFLRGGVPVEIHDNVLRLVTSTAFRSRLNRRGALTAAFKVGARDGELIPAKKQCSEDCAKLLLHTLEVAYLPEIKLVAASPLLVEVDGAIHLAQPGFNPESGVYVTGNVQVIEDLPLSVAVLVLNDLLRDFQFATPGDRARALAGLIAPAIRMGGFLPGNALVQVVEADESQAGKGTLCQLIQAMYGERAYTVVQKQGGVGSFDESLAQGIMSGAPFIILDNVRGEINSTLFEAAVTPVSGGTPVRVPHHGEVSVDTSRTLFQATSNGFSSTRDAANRLLVTSLLKQPSNYEFATWGGDGLLQLAANKLRVILGAVHAVVRHWHAQGKPRLKTPHTFREWTGALDWIVQNVFEAAPLLAGHQEAVNTIADRNRSWLRQLAIAVVKSGSMGKELRVAELRDICDSNDCLPDYVRSDWVDERVNQALGRTLSVCFRTTPTLTIDGIIIERTEVRDDHREYKPAYRFSKPPPPPDAV